MPKKNETVERMIEQILPRSFKPDEADEDRKAWKKRITNIVEKRTPLDKQLHDNVERMTKNPDGLWRR